MSTTGTLSERDRIEAELDYVTRACKWTPTADCMGAIVTWHLHSLALARAEAWIPGMAEGDDPVVETALSRFHHYQFGRVIQRLRDDNAQLKLKLTTVCRCLEFYADGSADVGIRATRALRVLRSDHPASETPEPRAGSPPAAANHAAGADA